MDEGIKKLERSIGKFGLWLRLSVMLSLAVACLLALRSLRPNEEASAAPDTGSREELERMIRAEIPVKFSEIIINGTVSRTTARELYEQHHARYEILNWQYFPSTSRYVASIKLSWQPDPHEDFWVLADFSAGRHPSSEIGFKVREASPDYEKAFRSYFDVLLKYYTPP